MCKDKPILDSGQRREYPTGAVRDRGEDKGLPSLISPIFIKHLFDCFDFKANFQKEENIEKLSIVKQILYTLLETKNFDRLFENILRAASHIIDMTSIGHALQILSIHLEKGAKKYTARNWEKGFFLVDIFDSMNRHIDAMLREEEDEDHYAAILCNIMFFYHTLYMIQCDKLPSVLNDLPQFVETKDNPIDIMAKFSDEINKGRR